MQPRERQSNTAFRHGRANWHALPYRRFGYRFAGNSNADAARQHRTSAC